MRVNIIGCAPGCQDAPLDKGERWGLNDNHKVVPQIDVIIDCHNLKRVVKEKEKLGRRNIEEVREHLKLVKKKNIKMYSTRTIKNMPSVLAYPISDIIRKWGSDYFGGGADYAVALAIYKGFTEIHLYGILLIVGDEYYQQKPTLEHWIGVAIGAGVTVEIHDSTKQKLCSVLKTPTGNLYGYNLPQRWRLKCDQKQ